MRTAKNPMIAIQHADAFCPSCSNRLMVANQNAHSFGPSSTVARMKMKMMMMMSRSLVVSTTKLMFASRHNSNHHPSLDLLLLGLLDLVLLGLPFLGCP